MLCSEMISRMMLHCDEHVERTTVAFKQLREDQLNLPRLGHWSPLQIAQHLALGHEAYIEAMTGCLARAIHGDPVAQQTWIGKRIAYAAGPESNFPAPKKLKPIQSHLDAGEVDRWMEALSRHRTNIGAAMGKDLVRAAFKNPIVPLIKMNLVDGFTILDAHAERHIRQIEALARS